MQTFNTTGSFLVIQNNNSNYYLLQLSFPSVAVVVTLVTNKNKYISRKRYKNTLQTILKTVNTNTRITKTTTHYITNIHAPTHYKTHTYTHSHITKQVKTTTVQDRLQIKQSLYDHVPSVYKSEFVAWSLQTSTVIEYWFVNAFKMDTYLNIYNLPYFSNRLYSKSQIAYYHSMSISDFHSWSGNTKP